MSALAQSLAPQAEPGAVLGKAVTRAAERLALPRGLLAQVLGLSSASVSRLFAGSYRLEPRRKEWEFALLLIRMFRALDSIVGGEDSARQWLTSDNLVLGGRPIDLIRQTEGLVRVVQYLDASRAVV